jgi:serine/threonine-protein kinase
LNLSAGLVVADRFRLERLLGEGGMGSVWLAHHTALDVPCAVKFIHADAATSSDVRSRFEREAKAAAQLRSPNVVQILDHGVWEGTPYIAMEYLEGEDLETRLARQRRLGLPETAAVASQVARALTRAHAAGLVHRDLKPANIFLVRDDDREIAKVLDFGIAKSRASALTPNDSKTQTGSLMGTPYYMSPEQAQGTREIDHRADLWGLAVVVYQCVTGQLPFDSTALGDLLVKIIVSPIPVPSHFAPVPAGFDAWWARAASRDPAQRFQSAKELAEALVPALGLAGGGVDPGLLFRGSIADPVSDAGSPPDAAAARPRPHTARPVVAALTAAPVEKGSQRALAVIVGLTVALALGSAAAFLLLQRPRPAQPVVAAETSASTEPTPAVPTVLPQVVEPANSAPPIVSAAPTTRPVASTPSAPVPVTTGAPLVKPPHLPPVKPGIKPPTKKTKTDFGI